MMRLTSLAATLTLVSFTGCGDSGTTPAGGGGSGAGSQSNGGSAQGAGGATAGPGGGGSGGSTASTMGGGGVGGSGGADPWAGPVESLKELDLGVLELGHVHHFPIPDRTLGLTTLTETTESGVMGISRLTPPTGGSVIYDFEIPGTNRPHYLDELTMTASDPQSDLPAAWPVQDGTWQLRLDSDVTPSQAHSRVFVRRTNDGAFHGGVVDFHVFIAGSSGVNEAYMTGVLDNMFANYYGPYIGLAKGQVTFSTIGDGIVGSYAEFQQLLASSGAAGSAPAINLYVIADFQGDTDNALGIAGGIPGSPMVHGTNRSGLAYTPTGNGGYDASVLAHEIGHVAGLFHTSEYQVTAFDPLADTAECTNIMNQNPDSCPDVGNVMFPIAYGGSALSAWQVRVVQGSAIYRGILQEGGSPSGPLPLPPLPAAASAQPEEAAFELEHVGVPRGQTELERALEAYWCARGGDAEALVWQALGAGDRAELVALAADASAFDVARARALSMLERFAATDADAATVARLASHALGSATSGRQLRLAALKALDLRSPRELEAFQETPAALDPVVAARAAALGY